MNFTKMIEGVLNGNVARRSSWEGSEEILMAQLDQNNEQKTLCIKNADNTLHPVYFVDVDLEADDWVFKNKVDRKPTPVELKHVPGHTPIPAKP